MTEIMNGSTKKRVNKEWGIEEERYRRTAPDPSKPGRRFRKRDSLPIIFAIAVMVFVAVLGWHNSAKADGVTVTFDANGGKWTDETDPTQDIYIIETIMAENSLIRDLVSEVPNDPSWDGHNFLGWYNSSSEFIDANKYIFFTDENEISTGLIIYAGWGEPVSPPTPQTYTVTFNSSNGGVTPVTQPENLTDVPNGTTILAPTVPTADGYTFLGWYKEAECSNLWDFTTDTVDDNVELFAKWLLSPQVSITGWTYGDPENTPEVFGTGDVAYDGTTPNYEYYINSACTTKTNAANSGAASEGDVPVNAGNYWVKATVSATATFAAGEAISDFTISRRTLTVNNGITIDDKTYDGTNSVAASSIHYDAVALDNVADRDRIDATTYDNNKISVVVTDASFPSANVSNADVHVSINAFELTGTSASNYTKAGTGNQSYAEARIIPKEVTISGITAEKAYVEGSTDNTATLDFTDATISGVADSDKNNASKLSIDSSGASGEFADTSIGSNKNVTITGLALSGTSAANYSLPSTTTIKGTVYTTATPVVTITGSYTYSGYAITPSYSVTVNGRTLTKGTDFQEALSNNVNAGTATLTVSPVSGNAVYRFTRNETQNFTIGKTTLRAANVTLDNSSFLYDGNEHTVTPTVRFGTSVQNISGFTVTGATHIDADLYTVTITAKSENSNVTGSVEKQYIINPKTVTVTGITAREKEYDGTTTARLDCNNATIVGAVSRDDIKVKRASGSFVSRNAGNDIEVTISNIQLDGDDIDNYILDEAGSQQKAYANITRISVEPTVTVSPTSYKYSGTAITPKFTVSLDGAKLTANTEYTYEVTDNNGPGTGHLIVSCVDGGNYIFDQITKEFTITQSLKTSHTNKPTKLTASATAKTVGDVPLGVAGWEWEDPTEELPAAGKTLKATAVYKGSDADDYAESANTVTVTITVPKDSTASNSSSRTGSSTSSRSSTTTSSRTGTSSRTSSSGSSTSSRTGSSSSSGSTSGRTGSGSRTGSSSGSSASNAAAEAKPPFIEGFPDVSGWDAISLRISGTSTGDSVPIYMNGTTEVPASLLNNLKDDNVTVVFDMGNSVKWNVNGMCILNEVTDAVDFGILTNTNTIPAELADQISATDYKLQLGLAQDGDYGCAPILSLNLGSNNEGLHANLFRYDPATNSLSFVTADEISADGTASLTFSEGGNYVIVVDKDILANASAHLDTPAATATEPAPAEEGTNPVSNIADPNTVTAYVQSQTIEENHVPKSAAVARRMVAPEVKKGVRLFWILLLAGSAVIGAVTFLLMNRQDLKARASARASRKALDKSNKSVKAIQKANNKKFKKYL